MQSKKRRKYKEEGEEEMEEHNTMKKMSLFSFFCHCNDVYSLKNATPAGFSMHTRQEEGTGKGCGMCRPSSFHTSSKDTAPSSSII